MRRFTLDTPAAMMNQAGQLDAFFAVGGVPLDRSE